MKKESLILPAILLCIICLVTTGLVALTFTMTLDARNEQQILKANANRQQLCPQAVAFEPISLTDTQTAAGLTEAYTAKDADGQTIAWLFTAQSRGYGGQVPLSLAIDPDGKITGLKILDNSETPGLGKKVAGTAFYGQYIGQSISQAFTTKDAADQQHIDAIAGATISSNAVTSAVNIVVDFYQKNLSEVK